MGGRILIVDDESAQMKALCNVLHDQGYTTAGFVSPSDALATLGDQQFDLLLTDLEMPQMDGISLLRAARERDGSIMGIVMTGHATVDTAVEAMKAGAFDYILKPFKLSTILPVLARALTVRNLQLENANLAQRIAERTAELETVNQELVAFSYSVAHDLRAPLRAINGFSSMLLEDFSALMPAEAQRLLQRVVANAEHMGQLIDALLKLSRLGRQPMTGASIGMRVMVHSVLEGLQKEPGARKMQISVSEIPDAVGDQALIKQVLVNLVSNAIKFTRHKDPATISVGSEERERETVYFIRDNGAGFDMQYADKLFGVFQRLHPSDSFEGTGIGLSIVQRIIHRHGGRIWAEAEVDKGATFFFTLPHPGLDGTR